MRQEKGGSIPHSDEQIHESVIAFILRFYLVPNTRKLGMMHSNVSSLPRTVISVKTSMPLKHSCTTLSTILIDTNKVSALKYAIKTN